MKEGIPLFGGFGKPPRTRTAGVALILGVVVFLALRRSEGTPSKAAHAIRRVLATSQVETDRRWAFVQSRLSARGTVQLAWSPSGDVALAYNAQFALAPVVLTAEPLRVPLLLEDPRIHGPKWKRPESGLELVFRTREGISLWRQAAP